MVQFCMLATTFQEIDEQNNMEELTDDNEGVCWWQRMFFCAGGGASLYRAIVLSWKISL